MSLSHPGGLERISRHFHSAFTREAAVAASPAFPLPPDRSISRRIPKAISVVQDSPQLFAACRV
jgi:hypothetical protein